LGFGKSGVHGIEPIGYVPIKYVFIAVFPLRTRAGKKQDSQKKDSGLFCH